MAEPKFDYFDYDVSANPFLPQQITKDCMQGITAAYNDYGKKEPNDPTLYKFRENLRWYSHLTQRFVKCGRVYTLVSDPRVALVAFRGTSTPEEIIGDLSGTQVAFKWFHPVDTAPQNVSVHRGFHTIYTTATAENGSISLQQSLFDILSLLEINLGQEFTKIVFTGHSLGGAIASMCAIDFAVSWLGPDKMNLRCYTFGSPRVGYHHYRKAFHRYQNLRYFRVFNEKDKIPGMPPEKIPFVNVRYCDAGEGFGVNFHPIKKETSPDGHAGKCHSMANYKYVLKKVVASGTQTWSGKFKSPGANVYDMISEAPEGKRLEQIPDPPAAGSPIEETS